MSNLDSIDIFVKVVQCGSFTVAAKILRMPITTVSGRIRSLESRLKVTLIHRTTRKLSITNEGKIYYEHCLKAVQEVAEAERALQKTQSEPEGLLRISAASDIGKSILAPIIKQYTNKYPKTKVQLILTNRIVDLVGESIDIAFRPGKLEDSTLIARKFMESGSNLWASPAYIEEFGLPKKISDIQNHRFINFSPFGDSIKMTNGKKTISLKMNSRIIVDDFEAAKVFITQGDGIGILPNIICKKEEMTDQFIKVLPSWSLSLGPNRKGVIYIVYPPQKYMPPKIKSFIDLALS